MSLEIAGQFRFLLASLCMGMALMAGYDVLRFVRFLVFHKKILIWFEDILYWCLASFPLFFAFFRLNQGNIRSYSMVALFGGAFLYEFGISRILRGWGNAFFQPKKRKIKRMISGWKKKAEKRWKRMFCADHTKKGKKRKNYCKTRENRL